MEKYITIKQSDFEAILGYVDTVLELSYPEGKDIERVNSGYETFIKPFRETDKLQTPEAFVKKQEFETFCENLEDCYGVDVFAADKTVLLNLFDKFNEEFVGATSETESDIVTRLVNTTPLPALFESTETESETLLELLFGESCRFVKQILDYSEKSIKTNWSEIHDIAPTILDFATQTIEEVVARTEGVKPICFDIEHKGYKLPENIPLQKPDYPATKKGNMAYWDEIEDTAGSFARGLLGHLGKLEAEGDSFDEDDLEDVLSDIIVDVEAEVTEFTVDLLIKKFDAVYPYVDENY